RLNRLRGGLARRQRRHVRVSHPRLAHPQTLVGTEKEQLVLLDRATQDAAEIVLPQFGLWEPLAAGKPVVLVERVVAEVLERGPVHLVPASLRDDGYLRSWSAAEFRRKRRRLNAEFLQRIERNEVIQATKRTRRRKLTHPSRTKTCCRRTDVGTHTIDHEVIRV